MLTSDTYALIPSFSSQTEREWKEMYLGYLPLFNGNKSHTKTFHAVPSDYPSHLDWRSYNIIPPVKNQYNCNSSYAFSAIGALEGASALVTGKKPPFSEQNIIDCSSKSFL